MKFCFKIYIKNNSKRNIEFSTSKRAEDCICEFPGMFLKALKERKGETTECAQ